MERRPEDTQTAGSPADHQSQGNEDPVLMEKVGLPLEGGTEAGFSAPAVC